MSINNTELESQNRSITFTPQLSQNAQGKPQLDPFAAKIQNPGEPKTVIKNPKAPRQTRGNAMLTQIAIDFSQE